MTDNYIQYEDGSLRLSNNPPEPTHKTNGLTQTEWIGLFLPQEVTLHTKTRALINDVGADFSYLTGGELMDQPANSMGRNDATYRDLMRDVYFHFDRAAYPPGINTASQTVAAAMAVQVALGLLTQERASIILQGKPL